MLKKIYLLLILLFLFITVFFIYKNYVKPTKTEVPLWSFMSIDTMKYSRDLSREKLNDQSFDKIIDTQVKNIAATGATHIGIDTPYDDEFLPMLKKWVDAARKYNLNVWFRGNWSGWEGWFDYPKIDRQTHIAKTKEFILKHKDIFINGDVFTACPECENGGPGDPRFTGDIEGYRQFLINEYKVTKNTFKDINKQVASNYDSMNGDVATAIMDKETTKALDGVVAIDHYVATPEQLVAKINEIANQSGGKVILGEFGAPIPDINGDLTQEEQAMWIFNAFKLLKNSSYVLGMNYWTNQGSSTSLWNDDGSEKKAVKIIKEFYSTRITKK